MTAIERFERQMEMYPPRMGGDKPPDFEQQVALVLLELIAIVKDLKVERPEHSA